MIPRTIWLGGILPLALATSIVNVKIPSSPPSPTYTIDPSFPNFALEFSSLLPFTSTSNNDTSPSQYSINMLNAVFTRTGGHPVIRVGGTSADYALYVSDQVEPVFPEPNLLFDSNVTGTTFGPSFWPLTKNFASLQATWVPQISFAVNNQTQLVESAQAAVDGIGLENIESIELGNEPNFYPFPTAGPPEWVAALNNTSYADRFRQYVSLIADAISLPKPFWQAGDIGAIVAPPFYYPLNVTGIFGAGLNSGGIVKNMAGHFYAVTGGTVTQLLNHTNTVVHMAEQKGWVDYLASIDGASIPLIMDEANVITGPANVSLESSLASAVWRTDYFLYCASIGIKRVQYESVFTSLQSVWQPSDSYTSPAQTRAAFYAYPPMAEFIGETNGTTKVSQIPVNGTIDGQHLIAYAAYNGSVAARMALVNFNEWSNMNSTARPSSTFSLTGLGCTHVTVKYLSSDEGATGLADGITYGGSQWTAASSGKEVYGVRNDTVVLGVKNGKVKVPVPYTSVAMVFLQ